MAKPQKPPFIYDVARDALGESGGSVWASYEFKWFNRQRNAHAQIERYVLGIPTLVTKNWRVHFLPDREYVLLPPELPREEAERVAQALMDLENIRRST